MGNAGKEKSTDAFRFRKGLLPEGDMRGECCLGERLLFLGMVVVWFRLLLPWLLEASPKPEMEYSMLLPYPTALPAMLPSDPLAPKSSDEPLRGRIVRGTLLLLLLLLLLLVLLPMDNEAVVVVAWADGVVVVAAGAAAGGTFCSCGKAAAAGEDFTRGVAAFEAMSACFGFFCES